MVLVQVPEKAVLGELNEDGIEQSLIEPERALRSRPNPSGELGPRCSKRRKIYFCKRVGYGLRNATERDAVDLDDMGPHRVTAADEHLKRLAKIGAADLTEDLEGEHHVVLRGIGIQTLPQPKQQLTAG